MKITTQATPCTLFARPKAGATALHSGTNPDAILAAAVANGAKITLPDGTKIEFPTANPATHLSPIHTPDSFTHATTPLTDEAKVEAETAYKEAKQKVGEVLRTLKDCEGLPVKKLETSWKSGLLLGGIGGAIMISALTLKLMLENIKNDDPETYNKLKNYQWPVLIGADIYGLLFFKKAYQAWNRPHLKEIKGRYDIYKHLAENGLVIPELLTMLKQCESLIKETAGPNKRFTPAVYELLKEKATWAEKFITFLVEPESQFLSSPKLNLKNNNYALVNLTKEEAVKKLNIKNLLHPEAKESTPWHEQLLKAFEFPIDWTVGLLTGERLATVQEVQELYNKAWQQKLLTDKNEAANRYLSQVNAEIESLATSDYSATIIPSEKQVSAMLTGNFPQQLLAKPLDGRVLTAQLNNINSSNKPLDNPEKDDALTITSRLNVITAIWGSACQALLFPKPKT
ncbi:MAG: hypothetical protein H2174_02045 [Vampirovibrio sp.]|nr:hypothetical protein [Vampirovibrio sp.]